MRKHFFLVILGTLSSLCPCAADFIVHNGGACVFQFGWTYYGGQGLDLNCHPEITTSSCCATLGPGQEAPFPRGVVCPADGFSITPFGGQPTEEFTVAKYGADFTIVYNCGIAQVKDPSVNDDDDDDDCKNQSDDNTCADCSAMPRWAVSEPNGA